MDTVLLSGGLQHMKEPQGGGTLLTTYTMGTCPFPDAVFNTHRQICTSWFCFVHGLCSTCEHSLVHPRSNTPAETTISSCVTNPKTI